MGVLVIGENAFWERTLPPVVTIVIDALPFESTEMTGAEGRPDATTVERPEADPEKSLKSSTLNAPPPERYSII